jgi:hypothetical protein
VVAVLPCWGWAVDALDFRIEVRGSAAQGYEVMLRGPDGGEVSDPVRLPLSELAVLAARVPDAVIACLSLPGDQSRQPTPGHRRRTATADNVR